MTAQMRHNLIQRMARKFSDVITNAGVKMEGQITTAEIREVMEAGFEFAMLHSDYDDGAHSVEAK